MNDLPCGERVVRCLRGEPVDRVPFGVGLGWTPWEQTLQRWRAESGQPHLDVARALSYDASFALPELECGVLPHFAETVLEESGDYIVTRDWRGITMRNRRDRGSMPEFLDYPVKTKQDWRRLKEERLRVDEPGRGRQNWPEFRARLRRTGEAVQVGAFPWGVFGTARDLMGAELLLVSFYDEPELVREVMGHLTTLWLTLWESVAAEVPIDHIHIWEDMAGRQGSLISPAMLEQFMMPCYDRITAFARAHDVRLTSVDTDGNCRELAPVFLRHGVNVMFPFEVQAGNDVRDYRRQYPGLGMMGGLDKRALARSKEAIDREVNLADAMVRTGRYVPSFDHLIPPDAGWELFRYAAERLREVCNGHPGG
jgi:uroporphyrinogen decarboxylase